MTPPVQWRCENCLHWVPLECSLSESTGLSLDGFSVGMHTSISLLVALHMNGFLVQSNQWPIHYAMV